MAWDENGRLVPLDNVQLQRQLDIASELAKGYTVLPENRVLSVWESLRLLLADVAHVLDELILPQDGPMPGFLWMSIGILATVAWPVVVPLLVMTAAFRLWVWLVIERNGS